MEMSALAMRLLRDPFFATFGVMDDLLNRTLGVTGNGVRGWSPLVDVRELEDHYLVHADVPGVEPDAVAVEVDNGVLTITGERPQVDGGTVYRLERPYGEFQRSLTLPEGCDPDAITAESTNGVLELRIPKPANRVPRKIAIGGGGDRKELSRDSTS
jgi:HSP20 family protein